MFGKTRAMFKELLQPLEALNALWDINGELIRIGSYLNDLLEIEKARFQAEQLEAKAAELRSELMAKADKPSK